MFIVGCINHLLDFYQDILDVLFYVHWHNWLSPGDVTSVSSSVWEFRIYAVIYVWNQELSYHFLKQSRTSLDDLEMMWDSCFEEFFRNINSYMVFVY